MATNIASPRRSLNAQLLPEALKKKSITDVMSYVRKVLGQREEKEAERGKWGKKEGGGWVGGWAKKDGCRGGRSDDKNVSTLRNEHSCISINKWKEAG